MINVIFKIDQYSKDNVLLHKKNTKYECASTNENSFFIRQEGVPKKLNICSRYPIEAENKIFVFV